MIGQKGVNNGVIIFLFLQQHKIWIAVGRGLENPLTNPVCQEIADTIAAKFKAGDFEGGITAGSDAIMQTIKTPGPPQHTTR